MCIYQPYTYLIGWSWLDRWYYGSEYAEVVKIANPQNLWTTYFTSSKYVAAFREEHGEPDVVQVRKTFTDRMTTRLYEHRVLKRLKIRQSERWLNKHDGKAPSNLGMHHDEETKKVIGEASRQRNPEIYARAAETRRKFYETHEHHMKGKRAKPEHVEKRRQGLFGKTPWNKGLHSDGSGHISKQNAINPLP